MELYAMKQMNKKQLKSKIVGKGQNAYMNVLEELKVLQRLEHPNIIYLHEIIDDPSKDHIHLITQYHSKGSLADKLDAINSKFNGEKTVGLKTSDARMYLCDMLKALHYCHNIIKVIHRDIKPENIMINHNEEAVLIDFGVCFLVDQQLNDEITGANIGTFNYYSPEMWEKRVDENNNPVSIKGEMTDLWALGITFYKILTG
jgi:non-specific serine/threonine protein kinase